MNFPVVLSRHHVQPLLDARRDGLPVARTSLDLGLSVDEVPLTPDGVILPDGQQVTWSVLDEIVRHDAACFVIEQGVAARINRFSSLTNRASSLMATAGAPTIIIAGFTMHRIVNIDPYEDTRCKIKALSPLRGRVLDTCTGLGYTAIEAAKTAVEVVTVEWDPATLEIARLNPWSRGLFNNPRITQLIGDSVERVEEFPDAAFSCIMHDPPTFSLAGELYSGAFYRQLARVLKPGGRMFHYIGQVESKLSQGLARGVIRRLQEAGFVRVQRVPQAFGLVAYR